MYNSIRYIYKITPFLIKKYQSTSPSLLSSLLSKCPSLGNSPRTSLIHSLQQTKNLSNSAIIQKSILPFSYDHKIKSYVKQNLGILTSNSSVLKPKLWLIWNKKFTTESANTKELSVVDQGTKAVQVLNHNALVVARNYEWLNIFMGFEQANQYKLMDEQGNVVGFIAEESSLMKSIARNLLRTHRAFKATVMDTEGNVILTIRRPFYLLNSLMYIEDTKGEVLGEIHQRWHLWRRKYDLYVNKEQVGQINSPILSWTFTVQDNQGKDLALVDKNWTSFAREIFTDANQYAIKLAEPFVQSNRSLTLAERAVVVGMAVSIDFNYFSRTSGSGGWFPFFGFGHPPAQGPVEEPAEKTPETPTDPSTVNSSEVGKGSSSSDVNDELANDKWASPNDSESDSSNSSSIWDWFDGDGE